MSVRKISLRTRNRNQTEQERVPVLPLHSKYVEANGELVHDPFDDIIGAEIQITAAASGVVPDDTFTVTQAVNALGFGKFQIILSFVTGLCWMADSMEVMILSILSPALHCEWGVSQHRQVSRVPNINLLSTFIFFFIFFRHCSPQLFLSE
jgi:hypothetical protein